MTCVRQLTNVLWNKPLAAECALLQLLKNKLMLQLSAWEKDIGVEYVWTSSWSCGRARPHSIMPASKRHSTRRLVCRAPHVTSQGLHN